MIKETIPGAQKCFYCIETETRDRHVPVMQTLVAPLALTASMVSSPRGPENKITMFNSTHDLMNKPFNLKNFLDIHVYKICSF